jgi:hypothetical protein
MTGLPNANAIFLVPSFWQIEVTNTTGSAVNDLELLLTSARFYDIANVYPVTPPDATFVYSSVPTVSGSVQAVWPTSFTTGSLTLDVEIYTAMAPRLH